MSTKLEPVQTFKILIVGDPGVGKTSLMDRFVHGVFKVTYTATIGIDFKVAIVNIGEYKCRLQIWDTAGQERFRSLTSSYYRGADGIIIVYDVTSKESFDQVRARLADLESVCDDNVPKLLVGNKSDDDNQTDKLVVTLRGEELAAEKKLLFYEISVKDNKNITEAFNQLTKLVLQRRLGQAMPLKNSIPLEDKEARKHDTKKWWCVI